MRPVLPARRAVEVFGLRAVLDRCGDGRAGPTGIVGFRATYLVPGGGVGVQQERSRFVREDGLVLPRRDRVNQLPGFTRTETLVVPSLRNS